MKKCLSEALQEFREDVYQVVMSLVSMKVFTERKVRELQVKKLDTFHVVVMKLR